MADESYTIYRHPDLSWPERIFCWIIKAVSPLKLDRISDAASNAISRQKLDKFTGGAFDSSVKKIKYMQVAVHAPREGGGSVEVLIVRPADPSPSADRIPLVVHMHGGGYTIGGPKDSYAAAMWEQMLKKGCAPFCVASVAYRIAPEHPAPAAQLDVEAALAYLASDDVAARFGYDPRRLHLHGNSAGAGLALVVGAAMARRGEARTIRSLLLDSPMVDPSCSSASYRRNAVSSAGQLAPLSWLRWAWSAYLGGRSVEEALRDPAICPHLAPGGLDGVAGLRVLLLTGKADLLHDEGVAVGGALTAAGASVTHIDARAGHCMGMMMDKAAKARALDALVRAMAA